MKPLYTRFFDTIPVMNKYNNVSISDNIRKSIFAFAQYNNRYK